MANGDHIELPTLEIPVEFDLKQADRTLRDIEARSKQTGERSAEGIGEAAGQTKRWTDRLRDAASAAGGLAVIVGGRLFGGFRRFGGILGKVLSTFVDVTAVGMLGVSRGLRRMDAELEDNGRAWKFVGDAAGGAASILEKAAAAIMKVSAAITGVQVLAAATTAAFVILANRVSAEFTPNWNRVLTLLDGTPEQLRRMRTEVSDLAGEIGVAGTEAADTLYEIISAAPELAREPARAMEVLRVSLEAGATGFVKAADAAKTTSAILSAFNLEASEARRVSDALFVAQDQGVLTFGEIAASIGRVSGPAAALNVEFEELLGIAAKLTPTGQSVAEIFTQVRAVLNAVLRPTAEARRAAEQMGIDFSTAALRSKGLVGFLTDLIDATDGSTDALAQLFTSAEALNLIVGLSDDMEGLADVVELVGNASGQTADKLETMNDSWDRQKEILRSQTAAILREIGELFEDVGATGLRALNNLIAASESLGGRITEIHVALQDLGMDLHEAIFGDDTDETWGRVNERISALALFREELQKLGKKHLSEAASSGLADLAEKIQEEMELLPESSLLRSDYNALLRDTQEQLGRVNEGMEEFAKLTRDAAAAEHDLAEEARLRREEIEFLMFGEAALAQNQAIPGVRGGPISRPALPTSPEFSRHRIQQLETLRQAKAIAELARSGDMEAYEAAVRSTQEAVNDLVLAEMDRLRAAGVEEREVAKLASSYRVLRDETDRTAEAKQRLQEQLSDRVFRLTADAIDLEAQALDRLATEIKEKFGEIPDEMAAQLEQLRQNIERSRVLATFQEQFQALGRGPATLETADAMAALHDQLREEAEQLPENLQLREEYLELLHQIARAIDRIRDSERKAQDATEDTATQEQREAAERLRALREQARTIEENARAGIQLAEAFGLIGSEAADALQDVAQLGAAIFRIASGDFSAIPAAIGAFASLVSGLLGGAESEFERRKRETQARLLQDLANQLARNTRAIEENTRRLSRETTPAARDAMLSFAQRVLTEALASGDQNFRPDLVDAWNLRQIEEEMGISLLTEGGVLNVAALRQFIALLQSMDFSVFGEDLMDRLDGLNWLFGQLGDAAGDAETKLASFVSAIREFSPGFAQALAQKLEEEGPEAAQAWLQGLIESFVAHGLTPGLQDLFGGGLSAEEIQRLLGEANTLLGDLVEGTAGGGVVGGPEQTRLSVNITQAQANQLISLDMTRNRYLAQMVALLGGGLSIPTFPGEISPPSPAALGLSPAPAGGGDTYITLPGDIDVTIGPIHADTVDPATLEPAARRAAETFSDEVKRALGNRHRGQGGHGSPKVLTVGTTR